MTRGEQARVRPNESGGGNQGGDVIDIHSGRPVKSPGTSAPERIWKEKIAGEMEYVARRGDKVFEAPQPPGRSIETEDLKADTKEAGETRIQQIKKAIDEQIEEMQKAIGAEGNVFERIEAKIDALHEEALRIAGRHTMELETLIPNARFDYVKRLKADRRAVLDIQSNMRKAS